MKPETTETGETTDTAQTAQTDDTAAQQPQALSAAQLEAAHPALHAQLRAQWLAEGATRERVRIQGVLGHMAGFARHQALIYKMAFDGASSPEQAALAVMQAERCLRAQHEAQHRADAPAAVPEAAAPEAPDTPGQIGAQLAANAAALWRKAQGGA